MIQKHPATEQLFETLEAKLLKSLNSKNTAEDLEKPVRSAVQKLHKCLQTCAWTTLNISYILYNFSYCDSHSKKLFNSW